MSSPTARCTKWLENQGYTVAKVEYWSPYPQPFGRNHDLLGFIDLLAFGEQMIIGIQVTDATSVSKRITKILEHENLPVARRAGLPIWVVGFYKGSPKPPRVEIL